MSLQQLLENHYNGEIPTNATTAHTVEEWLKDTASQLTYIEEWINVCRDNKTLGWDDLCALDSGISEVWETTKTICTNIDAEKHL